ncbi:MAG: hypothetical protein R3C03_00135 [Pirellulaceae bacterium]
MKFQECFPRLFVLLMITNGILVFLFENAVVGQEVGNASESAEVETRLQIDPALLLQMKCVWEVIGQEENPVWPGWDARETPVMFYLPGIQDVLINHPSPPDDFVPYTGPLQAAFPQMSVRDGKTEIEFDGQNTSRVMFGEQTLIVADTLSNRKNWLRGWASGSGELEQRLHDLEYRSMRADPYSQMEMIAHEAFHVFQYKFLNHTLANDFNARYYPCLDVEGNVALVLEGKAMLRAIKAESSDEARKHALQWLAIRLDRRKSMNDKAIAFEDDNEFMEGLATYAGLICMESLEGRESPEALDYVQGFYGFQDMSAQRERHLKILSGYMRGEINVNNDRFGVAPARKRMYSSGLGIALMLDRIAPEVWKTEISRPEMAMTELIRKHLDPTEGELESALAAGRDDDELADLNTAKQALANEGNADTKRMVDEIVSGPNTLIVIDWSDFAPDQRGLSYTSFGLRSVDETTVIYTLVPIQAIWGKNIGGFKQQIPRPTLDNSEQRQTQFQLTESVSQGWLTEKIGTTQDGTWSVDELELELPGASVNARKASISLNENVLTIKILNVPVEKE